MVLEDIYRMPFQMKRTCRDLPGRMMLRGSSLIFWGMMGMMEQVASCCIQCPQNHHHFHLKRVSKREFWLFFFTRSFLEPSKKDGKVEMLANMEKNGMWSSTNMVFRKYVNRRKPFFNILVGFPLFYGRGNIWWFPKIGGTSKSSILVGFFPY